MKIIHQDLRKGIVKTKAENLDDLWYLSHIIDKGDLISGKAERKIQLASDSEKSNQVKKTVFVKIKAEKLDLEKDTLRINGTIEEGQEDVPKGSHQTIEVRQETIISIEKEKWLGFQIEKLKQAQVERSSILMCVHDREEAYFALLKRSNYQLLAHMKGDVDKKGDDTKKKGDFYSEIIEQIREYKTRYKASSIIVASPAFFKEDLFKQIKDELGQSITLATCSSVSESSFDELMKREETRNVLKQDIVAKETVLVEEFFTNISKSDLAVYGVEETEKAVQAGAAEKLLVTDFMIYKSRESGNYERIDKLMRAVESMKGKVNIISSEHDAGKRLDGIGGIGAILRYKMNY
ncbi:mRNA surveillance protein pelota [Candidatus Woesearchaeota archaeon]|nr:mRNA surveillance protein pelota [Candidatus Woesearchaeota archaeon]